MLNKQLFDKRMEKLLKAWNLDISQSRLLYQYCHGDVENWGLDLAIDLMEDIFSPTDKWISWWIMENDCGKNDLEAGYDHIIAPVKTVEDLWGLLCMEEDRNK